MFIDMHAHAYHTKIASKVVKQLSEHYDVIPFGNGLIEDLIEKEQNAGLDMAVVLCAATTASQVIPANNFALELQEKYQGKIEVFGAIHPDFPDWQAELERLKNLGVKGLKLHPDFQGFFLDDPRLFPVLDYIGSDFLVMCHIGDKIAPKDNPSCPYKLQALREKFPKVRFIAAHLGGYCHWQYALETYIGKEVYIDTCSSLPFMSEEMIQTIFKKHPMDYILFGSDYPIFDPKNEIELLSTKAKLNDQQIERILSNGARALAYI